MARPGLDISYSVLSRHANRVAELSGPALERVKKRTLSTVNRRVKPEAARLLSAQVLNLSARTITPYIGSRIVGDSVVVTASRTRLPLSAFKPRRGPGGVIATLWRDSGPREFPHTFIPKGGKEVWQRVPYSGQKGQRAGPSGLVHRTPIVVRKGPSFYRALIGRKHGDIFPELMVFARSLLSEEIARLLESERGR